jgi:hypothetical protein
VGLDAGVRCGHMAPAIVTLEGGFSLRERARGVMSYAPPPSLGAWGFLERGEIMEAMAFVRRGDEFRPFTASDVDDRVDRTTRAVADDVRGAPREAILRRLTELDGEWDAERSLATNLTLRSSISLELGSGSAICRWLAASQTAFLLLHTLFGWCRPVPIFRRMGFRTTKEIQREREELFAVLRERG